MLNVNTSVTTWDQSSRSRLCEVVRTELHTARKANTTGTASARSHNRYHPQGAEVGVALLAGRQERARYRPNGAIQLNRGKLYRWRASRERQFLRTLQARARHRMTRSGAVPSPGHHELECVGTEDRQGFESPSRHHAEVSLMVKHSEGIGPPVLRVLGSIPGPRPHSKGSETAGTEPPEGKRLNGGKLRRGRCDPGKCSQLPP